MNDETPQTPPPRAETLGPRREQEPTAPKVPEALPAAPLTTKERLTVGVLSAVQCAVFAWATVLPWDKTTVFVALSVLLATSHGITSVACLLPGAPPLFRLRAWFGACAVALLFLTWATWAVVSSAVYLSALYGGLGRGLGAALVAIWALGTLTTLPMFIWGTYRTWGVWRRRPVLLATGVASLALVGALGAQAALAAAPDATRPAEEEALWLALLEQHVQPLLQAPTSSPRSDADLSKEGDAIEHGQAATCKQPLASAATVFVHFIGESGKTQTRCLQRETLEGVAASLGHLLAEKRSAGPVSIDRLTGTRNLAPSPSWLLGLSLRPGLDGACLDEKCLTPWQLITQSRFVRHVPLDFLGDFKLGISLVDLAEKLAPKSERKHWRAASAGEAAAKLVAVTTHHVVLSTSGELTPLVRLHPVRRELTLASTLEASRAFETHILEAQQDNGQFRYTLDPFTRKAETRELNLARQAGTLLALCEAGSATPAVDDAARRGLELLLRKRRETDGMWALSLSSRDRHVRLGDSALPLVSMLACRARVGTRFDEAIVGLSRYLLHSQRADGSFATDYDWRERRPVDRGEALYAPGQALLALTLLESLVAENPEAAHLGSPEQLAAAVQRGMDHVASSHWDIAMYPFFFVEENWNCLTARAALRRQRNDAYERFCLDYVRFRSRLILTPDSDVSPEYWGGFGFGNIVPPHNTGAAGFGEALSAAIAVARARSMASDEHEATLRLLLEFLLRQQWTRDACPMCAPEALGSLSEHMHSPVTRIDFAQHAWAALSHGARVLRLTGAGS